MGRFEFTPTALEGLVRVQRRRLEDSRGFLSRFYCAEEFAEFGIRKLLAQINHTLTRHKGTVRGMHYQAPPHAELKVVSCVRGEVFDVAVDLRKQSPTFLRWHGEMLSAANQRSLLIPEGFAHGVQALTDDCELLYLTTAAFHPTAERGVNATDPRVAVTWPLEITEMSERDRSQVMLPADFTGIEL